MLPAPLDEASDLVLREIRSRLKFLLDVGLGYLTLDRQSRTLSGGEVQRINLTTALGTSLVNTLFVLDEPSIGLHPRDMGRVIDVMKRLKQSGNSLLVVEHDPQVMQAADRILDVGPGPGEKGGQIVFFDRPAQLPSAQALAHRGLSDGPEAGERTCAIAAGCRPRSAHCSIRGARQHNLKSIDVAIPLNRLVCITGVSGSGKSTLVQDVLYPALRKRFGKPTEVPGAHERIEGADTLGAVVMVDQAQIGRTTRSNPASYVGAFDAIRKLYAAEPLAKERGYTLGTFSFNSGTGRCPSCGGNGFEHVEMQFLSDVYLRCAECNGRRYRAEILEVTLNRRRDARAQHRGRARHDGLASRRVLRRRARGAQQAAAAGRGRAGLPEARSAGADTVRRRSAAAEARRPPRVGGRAIQRRGRRARHVVPVRRADDWPALRRHRKATARVPPAHRCRPLAAGDRAQPRRHRGRGLADRPRSRRRRCRRPDRVRGHAA